MTSVLGINVLPSLFLMISPFLLERGNPVARWNEVATGVVIAAASALAWSGLIGRRLGAAISILASIWLFVSPMVLSYPAAHSGADRLVACLIITVSAIELMPGLGTSRYV